MPDPAVSIVVPTLSRPEALKSCLDSIERTADMTHETIVVTVAEDEESATVVNSQPVVHVVQPTRGGFVEAANLGMQSATGQYVMQINDDCELLPHSIGNAIRFLEAPAHDRIGQAAFFHNTPIRRNVYAQVQLDGEWYYVCHVRGLCYANFGLARRELYERLGYFDTRYFMYGADPDFSLKVWHEAGLAVAPCPGALLRHHELADDRAAAERAAQQGDNERLFEKWKLGGPTIS